MSAVDLYDQSISSFSRRQYLHEWLNNCQLVEVATRRQEIVGYGCIRDAGHDYRMTPLYADNITLAMALAHRLLSQIPWGPRVQVIIPEGSLDAHTLFSSLGLIDENWRKNTRSLLYSTQSLPFNFSTNRIYSLTDFSPMLV